MSQRMKLLKDLSYIIEVNIFGVGIAIEAMISLGWVDKLTKSQEKDA